MGFDLRQVVAGILTLTMFVMLIHMIKRDHFDSVQVRPFSHSNLKFSFLLFFSLCFINDFDVLYVNLSKGLLIVVFFVMNKTHSLIVHLRDLNFYRKENNFNFQGSTKKPIFCVCILKLVGILDP